MECGSQRSRFMARYAPFIRRSTRLREAAPAWQASFAEAKRKLPPSPGFGETSRLRTPNCALRHILIAAKGRARVLISMCLAVPAKIVELNGENAVADIQGVRRAAIVTFIRDPKVGDYVLLHAGFAIRKWSEEDVREFYAIVNGPAENQ